MLFESFFQTTSFPTIYTTINLPAYLFFWFLKSKNHVFKSSFTLQNPF